MKTYSAKPKEISRKWYVLDASQLPLGRLSTIASTLLIGKGKTTYTPHIDAGDYVIIINAKDLVVTGNKVTDKKYYRHSGFPGGLSESTLQFELQKDPTNVVTHSVRGMLPVNKLRAGRLARLKVYTGAEHDHAAQKPQEFNVKEAK